MVIGLMGSGVRGRRADVSWARNIYSGHYQILRARIKIPTPRHVHPKQHEPALVRMHKHTQTVVPKLKRPNPSILGGRRGLQALGHRAGRAPAAAMCAPAPTEPAAHTSMPSPAALLVAIAKPAAHKPPYGPDRPSNHRRQQQQRHRRKSHRLKHNYPLRNHKPPLLKHANPGPQARHLRDAASAPTRPHPATQPKRQPGATSAPTRPQPRQPPQAASAETSSSASRRPAAPAPTPTPGCGRTSKNTNNPNTPKATTLQKPNATSPVMSPPIW